MSMYDANIGPEGLPTQVGEAIQQGILMEQAPIHRIPILREEVMPEGYAIEKNPEPLQTVSFYASYNTPSPGTGAVIEQAIDDAFGPKDQTYLIHAKHGGKSAADEVFALEQEQSGRDVSQENSTEQGTGFMSKLSNFVGEHPGLTFGMALGTVGTFGAIAAETASGTPVDAGMNSSAKIGTLKAGASDAEASVSTVNPCEDSVESDCSYDPPAGSETPPPPENPGDGKGNGDKPPGGKDKERDDNLLPLPEKRNLKYWSTKLINELRKGKKGRISASPQAKKDLYEARRGQCSKAEQNPGVCAKLDKTLLKVLYKASQIKRFYIWHFTDGPHVPTSHHWDGDATDLRRYNGKAPTNKSMFPIIRRVAPRNKSLELIGPGDNAAHTGKKNGHWHIAVY